MLGNIWLALAVTFILALIWLRINDFFAHKGWISGPLSRKIIHIGTGPIFVLCWLLFPQDPLARFLAALVPGAITVQFALVGLGLMKDQASVDAMSRSGDRREILRGPLFYGIIFVIMTIFYWKDNPIGIIALMLLCGGDGLADVIGKRFGGVKLAWSQRKSIGGTAAMFFGGWVMALAVLAAFTSSGVFNTPWPAFVLPVTLIAVAATIVESLPFADVDNITVPAVCAILGYFLLPGI